MGDTPVMSSTADQSEVTVEVFADIACPFTHVGLKRVVEHVAELDRPGSVHVRAWPLEWVNGVGLDAPAVQEKAAALVEQLGVDDFAGLDPDQWPTTTIPALELAAAAYARDMDTGLAVSMDVRAALFEEGLDVSDPSVLTQLRDRHGLEPLDDQARSAVQADYDEGRRRGVIGSPHFWVDHDNFFCPALDLDRDDAGHLIAHFDPDGLAAFFARIDG